MNGNIEIEIAMWKKKLIVGDQKDKDQIPIPTKKIRIKSLFKKWGRQQWCQTWQDEGKYLIDGGNITQAKTFNWF